MSSLALALVLTVAPGLGWSQSGESLRSEDPAPLLGRSLDQLNLESIDGERFALGKLPTKSAIVLAWTGIDCPMSKVYLPRLRSLAAEFEEAQVQFFLVNSNSQDSLEDIRESARVQALGFPTLRDHGGALALRLGVRRTTEVLVLDRSRTIVYHGAVDDQYGYRKDAQEDASTTSVATYRKPEPSEHYLREALKSVLANKPIATPTTDPMGCALGLHWDRATRGEESELGFHEDIELLLQENCQGCHRPGGSAPFALTEYERVAGWADMIGEVVSEGRMPPWNADPSVGVFKNDRRLSGEQIARVLQWVDQGAPRGDPKKAPEPLRWPKGWEIGEPDLILETPAFDVPAEGLVRYRYVTVPANLEEDRWVEAAQVKSTGNEVVHHVLIFLKESRASLQRKDRPWSPHWSVRTLFSNAPKAERRKHIFRNTKYAKDLWQNAGGGLFGYFLAVLPGELPTVFPKGQAQFLPAGASLTFQIHYQTTGQEVSSTTFLALKFRDEAPLEVREVWAANSVTFEIPPGVADHPEVAKHRFQRGGRLLSLKPHMHVRGKSARYSLERLDGSRELLLNVPAYDFDWQHTYVLAEPLRVELGETLRMDVVFDNSEANPYNPNAEQSVYFGLQTDEEMLIGYFEVIWDTPLK